MQQGKNEPPPPDGSYQKQDRKELLMDMFLEKRLQFHDVIGDANFNSPIDDIISYYDNPFEREAKNDTLRRQGTIT